jgi:hypothetical protein
MARFQKKAESRGSERTEITDCPLQPSNHRLVFVEGNFYATFLKDQPDGDTQDLLSLP